MRIKCKTCGEYFLWKKTPKGGQPPKHCPKHRRARGEVIDLAGARKRKNARRRSKAGATAGEIGAELHQTSELAAALSLFADVPSAARYVGIAAEGAELEQLAARARELHPGVLAGDRAELGKRLRAAMHLCVEAAIQNRAQIAPRDLPHVMRAFAQVHDLMVGQQQPTWSTVTLYVVGADGKPFDPNAQPQPAIPDDDAPAPSAP